MVVIIHDERSEYANRALNYAIVHMTDWITALVGTCAWKVALEGELGDLKDLTAPLDMNAITYDELMILDELDDEFVGVLMEIIFAVLKYQETFILLYAIDKDVACDDEVAFNLAELLFNEFVFPQEPESSDFDIYSDSCVLTLSLANLFYVVATLLTNGEYDLNKDKADIHFFDKYYGGELPALLSKLDVDDKNIALLYDLVLEMEQCYDKLLNVDMRGDKSDQEKF
ncbi:hypothetical protein LPB86_19945 [Pedobacter sp. MC2016-14]|uniref:hypothetical protein n=1 Tax=Pedobacter sp. MC2016-14 TaxID=2897327 RepID=UPI001E458671|nr:hypothetical protein [Pedobacter sp. MC2016-14]MCD0490522.1 hypothetical protein [Pedobacter sp. MC2016-14]